jgi:WD40 repeat protein
MMTTIRCSACGSDIPTTMKFCTSCGTAVEAPPQAPQDFGQAPQDYGQAPQDYGVGMPSPPAAKPFDIMMFVRKYMKLGIAAVAAIILIIVAVVVFSPDKYELAKRSMFVVPGDEMAIVTPSNKAKIEIRGNHISDSVSMDGRAAAVLVREIGDSWSDGGTLYIVKDRAQKVAEGVNSYWFSASGNGIAYTVNESGSNAELWHYINGRNTRVTGEFYIYGGCAVSPDGKTLAYATYNGDTIQGFTWSNNRANSVGRDGRSSRDVLPRAVSNGGRFIYFERDGTLFVQRGNNEDRRERLGDGARLAYANKDLSQVIFNFDGRSFISRSGGSREGLSGRVYGFILPDGAAVFSSPSVTILGVSDFSNTFYENSDNNLVRISNRYETSNVVRNIDGAYLANDGKTLTYLRNGRISRVNGTSREPQPHEVVSDVTRFIATADGGAVFYLDIDGDIYYQKGRGRPVLVSNDFRGWNFGLFKGNTLFYVADSELFSSTGRRGQRVSGFTGDVQYVFADKFTVMVQVRDVREILFYRSMNGRRFELIYRE